MRKGETSAHFENDPDTPNPWLPSRTCSDSGMRRAFSTLLLAMSGIVGGVDVEENLATLADLVATHADELLAKRVFGVHPIASGRCILPATALRLRTRRDSALTIRADLLLATLALTSRSVADFI